MWQLLRIRLVKRFAKLAPVDLGVFANPRFHIFRVIVPTLQMPGAELSFGVLLIAGTLPRLSHFDLHFLWCRLDSRRSCCSRGWGGCGWNPRWRSSRCRALRYCFLSHAQVPLSGQKPNTDCIFKSYLIVMQPQSSASLRILLEPYCGTKQDFPGQATTRATGSSSNMRRFDRPTPPVLGTPPQPGTI